MSVVVYACYPNIQRLTEKEHRWRPVKVTQLDSLKKQKTKIFF